MLVRLSLFFITCISNFLLASSPWAHLELGAGNYGNDGHTKISQEKTVLKKLSYVSDAPNYIDTLENTETEEYNPDDQFRVLFGTLDQLIKHHGPVGIFHINDLYEEYAKCAEEKLVEYATKCGYDQVLIESVPGDYTTLHPEELLSKFNKARYDSVHLKNPEISFYHYGMDGDDYLHSDTSRLEARQLLQQLANYSHEGLFFFVIYAFDFIPPQEKSEFIEKGIFYHETSLWEPVPYIYPEGYCLEGTKVFFIQSSLDALSQQETSLSLP